MNNPTFGFEDLDVWKKANAFKIAITKLSEQFPPEEKYRLKDQLIRSARSIAALIAEGHGRFTYPDQIHFCIQARGSLSESINHLIGAFDDHYISAETLKGNKLQGKELERLLNGYLQFLRTKRDTQK